MRVQLADITIALEPDRESDTVRIEETYVPFMSEADPQITIRVFRSAMPSIFPMEADMIFESAEMWSLYSIEGKYCFVQRHAGSHAVPDRILVCDTDFRRCELFVRAALSEQGSRAELPNPLDYPLGQILMLCYLAQGRGLMVHACGVEHEGKGYLFAGNSGHGKSTMAELWKDEARILTDERLILQMRNDEIWMYGTPWRGDFPAASPIGVRLDRVFFLQTGQSNSSSPATGTEASALLLGRSFPPFWDRAGMVFTLDLIARIASQTPCSRLAFIPDESIVTFVSCLK